MFVPRFWSPRTARNSEFVGVFKDFSVVDQFVKREKTFVPREEYKPVYDHQKKLFEKGYECLLDYYKMSAEE